VDARKYLGRKGRDVTVRLHSSPVFRDQEKRKSVVENEVLLWRQFNGINLKKLLGCWSLILLLAGCTPDRDWRTASREPAGLAPDPALTSEAVLQVYAAPAWGWRGWFAVHTWIAAKREGEPTYTVYEVIGWRGKRGLPVLRIEKDTPDRFWYGEKPRLLADHRGKGVDALIEAVELATQSYPWPDTYRAFPGPNSNTFTAWIAREVPALDLDLPVSAIGSGFVD
jgi:hypothetical protein